MRVKTHTGIRSETPQSGRKTITDACTSRMCSPQAHTAKYKNKLDFQYQNSIMIKEIPYIWGDFIRCS
jgi:hypothetical protein